MISKFTEAFSLLRQHFVLISSIILTVWLPGNIAMNYIYYFVAGIDEWGFMRLTMLIEGVFGPLYIGALIYALFQIKSGKAVSYRQVMSVGWTKWGSLFIARFVAGIFILLGLILFIVPGVILYVRYALMDASVIMEGTGATEARARSTRLTQGRRWQIFGAGTGFSSCLLFSP